MPTVQQVAQYFLTAAPPNTMTPLKLQKLCAYAQAISLAYLGSELFGEELEAWEKGPVLPTLFHKYGDVDIIPLSPDATADNPTSHFSDQQRLVLATVNINMGIYEDWALSKQSHLDFPGDFGSKNKIPKEEIRQAFWNNPYVQALRRTDEPVDTENCKWVTGEDLLHVLGR